MPQPISATKQTFSSTTDFHASILNFSPEPEQELFSSLAFVAGKKDIHIHTQFTMKKSYFLSLFLPSVTAINNTIDGLDDFWCQSTTNILLSNLQLILSNKDCYHILVLPIEMVCTLYQYIILLSVTIIRQRHASPP